MRSIAFFLFTILATAADLRIDHVTACGPDLKKMQGALASVGIRSEYGGPHANKVSEMSLASFGDGSYLELIAVQPAADPKLVPMHEWGRQMLASAGPCAWAARTNDVAAEVARLKAAGVKVGAAERSGRNRPDGVRLDWETAQVGDRTRGVYFPFLIRDFTPRETRVFSGGKPTAPGITGVSKIVIAVEDLERASSQFRAAFALPEPLVDYDPAFGGKLFRFSDTPLVLVQPANPSSWIAKRIRDFGEGPVAIVLAAPEKKGLAVSSTSYWFGAQISWLDSAKLGWRLGVE